MLSRFGLASSTSSLSSRTPPPPLSLSPYFFFVCYPIDLDRESHRLSRPASAGTHKAGPVLPRGGVTGICISVLKKAKFRRLFFGTQVSLFSAVRARVRAHAFLLGRLFWRPFSLLSSLQTPPSRVAARIFIFSSGLYVGLSVSMTRRPAGKT